MSLEGRQLGEFEILERLGQGGMGEVYKARQTSLDRFVALKTLQSSLADNADYIARFRQEAKAAAALNHPNLVQVYSAGVNDGQHWFAMEYVEGESAQARLQRKERLDPLGAIAIAIHVATALDYGWRKAGLIHRDIKPANIFLSGDGEVKLGDLGLAKSAGQAPGLTTTGAIMGTPHYMSPEQLECMKDVDLRADIYSLGCTLYHWLTGQPPYVGNSSAAVMMKHLSAPVPDLRSVWPECPAELAAAVGKMMHKQPKERQQNYEEVIADLRRAYAVLTGASVPSVASVIRLPVGSQKLVAEERKSAVPVAAWIGRGAALLAAIGALVYFAPWKKGSATPGGTRSVVFHTPAGEREGGKKVSAASPPTEATPASGRTVAVVATPQPDTTSERATPAPVPQPSTPSTPAPSTPPSSATPKPATEVEKWFAQVDGPQQEAFRKKVLKPFETGVTDLQARYLATLDAAIAKASAAGQLAEALVLRTERQAFEKAQNVASDDDGKPASVQVLRAAFRQQFAKLDEVRTAQAKALLAPYDAILAKNQTLLTQRQHLDDALLLQTKRDEIALAWLGKVQPTPAAQASPSESAKHSSALLASREAPFENSLGIEFVPVPITGGPTDGQRVLFGVWKTRVQDYAEYARAKGITPEKPDYEQGPTHPAVVVSWNDAKTFCAWLTDRERATGTIGGQDEYRLPSDHEWSCAVGIGTREHAAMQPIEKNGKITDAFPWGFQWPPPKGVGNYAPSLQVDNFQYTSPVGNFSANRFGLRDLGGNAWEWCEDLFEQGRKDRVLRGAAWDRSDRVSLLSSTRNRHAPGSRYGAHGFRCVLGVSAR
jgi:serine/threonine protein kinase